MSSPTACAPAPKRHLACQNDPERWFDRSNRTAALEHCLKCPARRWCAQQALEHGASWGMWAGIWIDGRLAEVAHYLRAIVAHPPLHCERRAVSHPAAPPPARHQSTPADDHAWVRAAVTARSSGHCEIMAPGCRYTCDRIAARMAGLAVHNADVASLLYVVCGACEVTLERVERPIARKLGYVIDSAQHASTVPFYWRQTRWVLLNAVGRLGSAEDAVA